MHPHGYGAPSGRSTMRFLKRRFLRNRQTWSAAVAKYREYYKTIFPLLPSIAQQFEKLHHGLFLHDQVVERITRPAPRQLIVELADRRLEFDGVKKAVFPTPEELGDDTIWLYDEMDYVAPGLFAIRAIFDAYGFEVVASDVRVFERDVGRYILPCEPPPPPPTLFADRRINRRKGKR